VLLLTANLLFSQGQKSIDSLIPLLESKVDSVRIFANNSLAGRVMPVDRKKGLAYAMEGMRLAKEKNYPKGIADANMGLVSYYFYKGDFDSAIHHSYVATDIFIELKAYKRVAALLTYRALLLTKAERFKDAVDTYNEAITYCRKLKDSTTVVHCYTGIADLKVKLGNFEEGVSYHIKAQKIFEAMDNAYGQIVCLNNIASVYLYQKQYKKALENFEKVVEYGKKTNNFMAVAIGLDNAGTVLMQMKDTAGSERSLLEAYRLVKEHSEAQNKSSIVSHLASLFQMKGDKVKAENYFLEAETLYKAENSNQGLVTLYANLGGLYLDQGKYPLAIKILLRSEAICRKIGTLPPLKDVYTQLANAYSAGGNFTKAFEYERRSSLLKDSIDGDNSSKVIEEMEAKYQNDKKEKEIQLKNSEISKQESEIKQQNLQKIVLGGGITALLIMGIVLYRGNRVKRKANDLLQSQKATIEAKNKDITDSIQYAKRLQEAVLPDPTTLSNYFSDSFILFMPRDIVSGDFYWYEQAHDKTIVAVGDCTGHGVPGAFMSILGHNLLNQIVMEYDVTGPAEILRMLDKQISNALNKKGSNNEYNDGMDIAICSVDKKAGKLLVAGANRPVLIKRGDQIIELKPNKFPIGGIQDDTCKMFFPQQVDILKGDIIYLFSDGFYDQFGGPGAGLTGAGKAGSFGQGKKMKYKNLVEHLKNDQTTSLQDQKNKLEKLFVDWKGNVEQLDDVCVLGIRI
jgi:serine phosphatase RsbU (regulator of sigma subunit)